MMRLTFYAYCGMSIPLLNGATKEQCRARAARLLRRRRNEDYPVTTLERGREWEVMEPEDCMMVPDTCGVLRMSDEEWSDE